MYFPHFKMYNWNVFSIFIELYNQSSPHSGLEHFITPRETLHTLAITPQFPCSCNLRQQQKRFLSLASPTLDISYREN